MKPAKFSHVLTIEDAKRQRQPVTMSPDAGQCRAVAERFGWLAVDSLSATIRFAGAGEIVDLTGELSSRVQQACVATGQPVQERIDIDFAVRLVPAAMLEADGEEAEVELDDTALDIVGYSDGRFDLADIIAETLALSVNPWPRASNADEWLARHGVVGEDAAGPFGALAALREAMKKG